MQLLARSLCIRKVNTTKILPGVSLGPRAAVVLVRTCDVGAANQLCPGFLPDLQTFRNVGNPHIPEEVFNDNFARTSRLFIAKDRFRASAVSLALHRNMNRVTELACLSEVCSHLVGSLI